MNRRKKLNLLHLKFLIQLVIAIGVFLSVNSCNKDDNKNAYPALKVTNESNDQWPIKSVKLVGYEFSNLSIGTNGGSQTFILDKGMSGGYNDINVLVQYGPAGSIWTSSKKVNFNNGETTTVTLKGCNSYQGCNGYRLE
jgi:hypothetical protein